MFMAYKSAIDGSGAKFDPVPVPDVATSNDPARFPGGKHKAPDGVPYVWTYCLARYWFNKPTRADDIRDAATLPPPSRPVPSAATVILAKLSAERGGRI